MTNVVIHHLVAMLLTATWHLESILEGCGGEVSLLTSHSLLPASVCGCWPSFVSCGGLWWLVLAGGGSSSYVGGVTNHPNHSPNYTLPGYTLPQHSQPWEHPSLM